MTELHWEEPPHHPVLAPNAVHVWRASLCLSPPILGQLGHTLSGDEKVRAERFRFPEHSSAFLACRGILRDILSRYLGSSPGAIAFRYGHHGKPTLAAPLDRCGVRFNVSHSGGVALYAFTLESEVGIDVEELRHMPDRDVVAERFFSARENKVLRALPLQLRDRSFFQCWTCKEAYIKATGEGLTLPLDCIDVAFAPDEPPRLLRAGGDPEEAKRWRLRGLDPGEGYLATLATNYSCCALELYDWRSDLHESVLIPGAMNPGLTAVDLRGCEVVGAAEPVPHFGPPAARG